MSDYAAFLESKRRKTPNRGIDPDTVDLPDLLYDWQAAIVRWALRKGRAAMFCDCGLGKSFMQIAWAQALQVPTIILAPLCVAEQTVAEAAKLGIDVRYVREQADVDGHPIVITNYERLDKFDTSQFQAVVLDESSILKAFNGKTRTALIEAFAHAPYRLCCTATPSPNDITELANHAEFLGLMTRPEFLATWFIRVGEGHRTTTHHGWRIKRHAVQPFYRWMASWALAMRRPSDLGYADDGFVLPALRIHDVLVDAGTMPGALFPELGISGIHGRLAARRGSLEARIDAVVNLIQERGVPWLVWCGLNTESEGVAAELFNAVEVKGDDAYAEKVGAVQAFVGGRTKVLISKVSILGFGMNFQHCSNMVFVGIGDSYEQYYQAIRRCWRFGQRRPVDVYVVVSEAETVIVENVRRKEAAADALSRDLLEHMRDFEREEIVA